MSCGEQTISSVFASLDSLEKSTTIFSLKCKLPFSENKVAKETEVFKLDKNRLCKRVLCLKTVPYNDGWRSSHTFLSAFNVFTFTRRCFVFILRVNVNQINGSWKKHHKASIMSLKFLYRRRSSVVYHQYINDRRNTRARERERGGERVLKSMHVVNRDFMSRLCVMTGAAVA